MKMVLVTFLVSLTLVACGAALRQAKSSQPSTDAATTNAHSASRSSGQASAPVSCPNGSLEGCYSYNQMSSYLDAIEPMVAKFYQTQYPKMAAPRDVVLVPNGETRREPCGGYADSAAYEYCPASRSIYIGQDLLWSFYKREGDAAPAAALAHEWGHHVQVMLRVPSGRTNAESVRFENQADCLSGAFIKYADGQGWLESGDLGDVEGLLQAVGSREGGARDHGTVTERRRAFELGYKSGAKGCNSFYPSTPVG